jgi:hypothetical protein
MGEFLAGASWGVWFVLAAIIAAGLWAIVHKWASGDIAVAMIGLAHGRSWWKGPAPRPKPTLARLRMPVRF